MYRKRSALALLIVILVSGGVAWPLGQKMSIFAPADALIAEKRYSEAIDLLRGLLVSAPSKTTAIKELIAKTQLALADDEISAQRYNEALAALSVFWAQNPERADQAQKRIKKINQLHEEYNRKAKELLAYMSDPTNRGDPNYNPEVAKRLEDLDALDRNNPDSKRTITSLKETSLALVYQDKMKSVMSAGRALIDAGEYAKAAREFLKGFPLFKPEFENAGYDELTMQSIAGEARKAEAMPDAFDAAQAGLVKAVSDLAAAFASGAPERVAAALGAAQRSLDDLRTLRDGLFATGRSLATSFDRIPKKDKSPVEYQYLAYLDIFLRGRPDSFGPDKKPDAEKGKPEGMGGAFLAQTGLLLMELGKAAQASVDAAYAAAETAYDGGAYGEAQAAFARTAALVAPASQVLSNWALIPEDDFIPDLAELKATIAKAAVDAGRVNAIGSLASAGDRLSGLELSFASLSSGYSANAAKITASLPLAEVRAALDGFRASVRAIESSIQVAEEAKPALGTAAAAAAAALGDETPTASFSAYSARLGSAAVALRVSEFAMAAARGEVEADYIERELVARTSAAAAADALTDGQPSTRPERTRAGYKDPSPTAAAAALLLEEPKLAALAAWISGDLSSMAAESPDLRVETDFVAAVSRIGELEKKAAALKSRLEAALVKANQQKAVSAASLALARKDMEDAKARLAEAKASIVQDKGKGTKSLAIKKSLADARGKLVQGLSDVVAASNADFDGKVWDDFQGQYASVSADLGQTKKDYTIGETFRLLQEGQTYYEQALFDLAAESLNGAQELWREDNDADQEQVKYWQNLVKQASDTNNKREVKPSDALYYEIGSYLSEARKLYIKGDSLMKSGRKTDAAKSFDAARQNISYVTRAFPLNAEAGFLTLQILKSTDVEAYKISLPRRIQEARTLLASDASKGYSTLADLYKMEPTYAGLKGWLEEAEIAVGKRRAPPTKQQLASAAAAVAEAEGLLKTGRKDDAAKAEASLNAALTSDPTNKRALALLRDLKTLQGKTSGPSLGLADQATLDQATRNFASRQYNQAREQLSQLLSDANKRTRDVLKLDNDLKTLGY